MFYVYHILFVLNKFLSYYRNTNFGAHCAVEAEFLMKLIDSKKYRDISRSNNLLVYTLFAINK